MKRNLNFEEISDGNKYTKEDLVKVSCNGCVGCSECCEVTDDTIFLDPYDVYMLSKGLSKTFEVLINTYIDFTVSDGVITPYLKKNEKTKACMFLSDQKDCSIHGFRPGFCRLFPLGRIYDDNGDFSYFIQIHECPYPNKTKVKVKKWLGIENLSKYEEYIRTWHSVTAMLSQLNGDKEENMKLLNIFFVTPYDTDSDFYSQFEKRLDIYKKGRP